MKKLQSIWILKDGKVKIVKENEFKDALRNLPDGRYWNTTEKAYNKRSTAQNNSIFGIPLRILADCFTESFGYPVSVQWVHNFCKNPENGIIPEAYIERIKEEWNEDIRNHLTNKTTGEVTIIPFIPTTTKMRTVEAMEYYKNLQDFGWDYFNCQIPDPDPDYKSEK